jgi:uncharacterized protein
VLRLTERWSIVLTRLPRSKRFGQLSMNILVTGASGFIGSALVSRLRNSGHHVVPLRRAPAARETGPTWNPDAGQIHLEPAGSFDAVVHLAGETIAQRWTRTAKKRIHASRVDGTRLLCEALTRLSQPPRIFVCASATGFYGDRGDEMLDEQSGAGTGFLAEVCQAWEGAAAAALQRGIRVVHLRIGLVLGRHGGAVAKMLPAFRFGLGGRLGAGRQYWSWIALEDLVRAVEKVLQDDRLHGAVNAVSPEPATNEEFSRGLARVLRRPAFLPVPAFGVKLIFGEMGREALLASARVQPRQLLQNGFAFHFPQLDAAFKQVLNRSKQSP